jgi:putative tryptophan/tyrosine transport system substrate-binding protein
MKKLFIFLLFLTACSQDNGGKVSIAILTPVTHPSMEQMEKGFIQTLEEAHPGKYRFTTYNAQGNKTLMHSMVQEIIREDHRLVFTLGTTASHMAVENFAKKGISTPVVFTAVNDPAPLLGRNVTGVKELLNFPEELEALLKYQPGIKNILLVYNPAEPGLHKDQVQIAKILEEKNMGLTLVEVFQTNELFAKVSSFIKSADALLVLKDNTVVSGIDLLVKLCDKHQVPLMASDLDSPDRGAAFGYGVYEIEFGIQGAKMALKILEEGLLPGDIPVLAAKEFTLRINESAAKRQGIKI